MASRRKKNCICRDERPSVQNGAKMGITREEIKNLLKRLVDFVNGKYDDVLVHS